MVAKHEARLAPAGGFRVYGGCGSLINQIEEQIRIVQFVAKAVEEAVKTYPDEIRYRLKEMRWCHEE